MNFPFVVISLNFLRFGRRRFQPWILENHVEIQNLPSAPGRWLGRAPGAIAGRIMQIAGSPEFALFIFNWAWH